MPQHVLPWLECNPTKRGTSSGHAAVKKEEITVLNRKINKLARVRGKKEITKKQGILDLGIDKERDVEGIGMGVLSDGTPYLNQRGLAALCGVQNAHWYN